MNKLLKRRSLRMRGLGTISVLLGIATLVVLNTWTLQNIATRDTGLYQLAGWICAIVFIATGIFMIAIDRK